MCVCLLENKSEINNRNERVCVILESSVYVLKCHVVDLVRDGTKHSSIYTVAHSRSPNYQTSTGKEQAHNMLILHPQYF